MWPSALQPSLSVKHPPDASKTQEKHSAVGLKAGTCYRQPIKALGTPCSELSQLKLKYLNSEMWPGCHWLGITGLNVKTKKIMCGEVCEEGNECWECALFNFFN